MVMPGKYHVALYLTTREGEKQLSKSVSFNVIPLYNALPPSPEREGLVTFQQKANELARTITGTEKYLNELIKKVDKLKQAIIVTPEAPSDLLSDANRIAEELDGIYLKFNRDSNFPSEEENPPSPSTINERLSVLRWTHYRSTEPITKKEKTVYDILTTEFPPVYKRIKDLGNIDIPNLEKKLENSSAPYTPGRLPDLKIK